MVWTCLRKNEERIPKILNMKVKGRKEGGKNEGWQSRGRPRTRQKQQLGRDITQRGRRKDMGRSCEGGAVGRCEQIKEAWLTDKPLEVETS
jgi:hypothetical protein